MGGPTEQLAQVWGRELCPDADTFIIDSLPVLVAHIVREYSTSVCRKAFRMATDKVYSASLGQYYIGYKLHVVLTLDGVYHSMELTKISVHDSQYLKNITLSGLRDCLLLTDWEDASDNSMVGSVTTEKLAFQAIRVTVEGTLSVGSSIFSNEYLVFGNGDVQVSHSVE